MAGLQTAGQLAGRGVADVELFQQGFLEGFDRMLQGFNLAVALACNRGTGNVQVANVDQGAFADCCGTKDHVLQLPHVTGPAIAQQRRIGAGCQAAHGALNLSAGLLHKGACQQQNVLAALAQWRHFDVKHVQAIEQVLAKRTLVDHFFEVAVGGAEDPHIDLYLAFAAYPAEAAVIQKAQ